MDAHLYEIPPPSLQAISQPFQVGFSGEKLPK